MLGEVVGHFSNFFEEIRYRMKAEAAGRPALGASPKRKYVNNLTNRHLAFHSFSNIALPNDIEHFSSYWLRDLLFLRFTYELATTLLA